MDPSPLLSRKLQRYLSLSGRGNELVIVVINMLNVFVRAVVVYSIDGRTQRLEQIIPVNLPDGVHKRVSITMPHRARFVVHSVYVVVAYSECRLEFAQPTTAGVVVRVMLPLEHVVEERRCASESLIIPRPAGSTPPPPQEAAAADAMTRSWETYFRAIQELTSTFSVDAFHVREGAQQFDGATMYICTRDSRHHGGSPVADAPLSANA